MAKYKREFRSARKIPPSGKQPLQLYSMQVPTANLMTFVPYTAHKLQSLEGSRILVHTKKAITFALAIMKSLLDHNALILILKATEMQQKKTTPHFVLEYVILIRCHEA